MKTLIKPFIFIALALIGSTSLHAQTADEVINKYIDAIGGAKVVSSVTSMVIESNINVMNMDAPSKTYILAGKGFKSETDFNGSMLVQCITDKGGWSINPMAGQSAATAMPELQAKTVRGSMYVGGPLVDYAAKGYKVEMAGKDGNDFKLKLTASGGVNVTFYINTSTYLIDKTVTAVEMGGQSGEVTTSFSDYRKTEGGYVAPYKQEVVAPQYTVSITHTKIDVNKTIDPAIFEMPK